MICGALTTLSEEACEDVLDGAGGEIGEKRWNSFTDRIPLLDFAPAQTATCPRME